MNSQNTHTEGPLIEFRPSSYVYPTTLTIDDVDPFEELVSTANPHLLDEDKDLFKDHEPAYLLTEVDVAIPARATRGLDVDFAM